MKNILLIILIATFSSCDNSPSDKTKESDVPKSELERDYEITDILLQFDAEKIGLLSIIKDVPYEKTNSVLRDYLAKTFSSESFLTNQNPEYIIKLVDSIAIKNNLTRKLTASIIFSYQYEMITRDKIIEDYSTEREDYQYE